MLETVALNYEMSLAWIFSVMPQEIENTVRVMDGGAGDGEAIYIVGSKKVHIVFGDDPVEENVFVTRITNGYVDALAKERSYFVPETFLLGADSKPLGISPDDERRLIEKLAQGELLSIARRAEQGQKEKAFRTIGTHYSTENGVVFSNPSLPDNHPKIEGGRHLIQ
jgi:hypothetical protein